MTAVAAETALTIKDIKCWKKYYLKLIVPLIVDLRVFQIKIKDLPEND